MEQKNDQKPSRLIIFCIFFSMYLFTLLFPVEIFNSCNIAVQDLVGKLVFDGISDQLSSINYWCLTINYRDGSVINFGN